jgi:hypothetical protein
MYQPFQAPPVNPYYYPVCRHCGHLPAVDTTFRGHRGMILVMLFQSTPGPFCRDCGLAVFRDMTAKTLIGGWWGYASFFITPITVLINLARRGKVANLPAPVPPMDGRPYGRPYDPGVPLMGRPIAILGAAIPFLLVFFLVIVALTS